MNSLENGHSFCRGPSCATILLFTRLFIWLLLKLFIEYGKKPYELLKYENGSTSNASLEDQLKERDIMLGVLKGHLHKAQQEMKKKSR